MCHYAHCMGNMLLPVLLIEEHDADNNVICHKGIASNGITAFADPCVEHGIPACKMAAVSIAITGLVLHIPVWQDVMCWNRTVL